eukprot:CAMPEP_0118702962 /NCGR_PEP_ID=MMETSP0800-20121206/18239_1 /TAXON_ID=210618 ORGANISM="Striatella unipunctata, Strain CCMP2910" /NCGR_SAMPLE_ID=MMETSP0800 /ASSEMBLY_ACC=CAM_ASM_000638 /LENGTH=154 /DNA_ID=CAMNT_0006604335 /DNA_START=158 /DNA_END=622 /DNA_ORIENTATION=+
MAKGFDTPDSSSNKKQQQQQKKKAASPMELEQQAQANKYSKIASSGGQEYSIFVRLFGQEEEQWLPCGSVAVPRGKQVSDAIFANRENMEIAIVRSFPQLDGLEREFEYGYQLSIFPDDPIEIANKRKNANDDGFSIGGWISNLLSPIDDSNVR